MPLRLLLLRSRCLEDMLKSLADVVRFDIWKLMFLLSSDNFNPLSISYTIHQRYITMLLIASVYFSLRVCLSVCVYLSVYCLFCCSLT